MTLAEAIATGNSFRNPSHGMQFLIPAGDGYILSGTTGPAITFSSFDLVRGDWDVVLPVSADPAPAELTVTVPDPELVPETPAKKGK